MKFKSTLMGALALGCACAFGGESSTEKTRKAIAKLFPGWSLETEVLQHDPAGFHANYRGQDNVVLVHPKSVETPAVISRTVTLSDKNPCLFLKVATWNDAADYLLSVRVNGKEAMPARLINTPDFAPWEDIVVPLSAWRGSEAKIEVVLTANNWWYENAMLAHLEIAEGNGDMSIVEGKVTVGGYKWSYRAQNGEATIIAETDGQFSTAVTPCPIGDVSIPATLGGAKVTRIGRGAFKDCSGLTSVKIPEGVTRVGREAFLSCTGLRSVTIPPSVKVLDWDAFGNCNALTSVTLSEGLTVIDRGAFYFCFGLTSITLPSSVTYLGRESFLYCRSLASVQLSPNVTDLRWATFRGCNALTSVTIPASVTNIDFTAFCDTGAMTSFRVEESNRFYKSENGLLLTKDGTKLVRGVNGDVKIPSSVTTIGPCAFEGSVALRSVVIPPGVKSIDHHAFKQCRGMTAVTISGNVTSIGEWVFEACSSLTMLKMLGERPNAPDNVLRGCGNLKAIHVPAKAKSWAGMKEWQGIPLVFDEGKTAAASKVDVPVTDKNVAAQKLQTCDFLLNKDFKKNAKYYLCLFSASWCPPCRREMPRIAKMYAETLKSNPNIELIHFSRDQNDEKALAWAKEHDVKFPVVKPKGGNPLNLQCRGIPHLFIVKQDGTLVEEGHPAKLFTEEKLSDLK